MSYYQGAEALGELQVALNLFTGTMLDLYLVVPVSFE